MNLPDSLRKSPRSAFIDRAFTDRDRFWARLDSTYPGGFAGYVIDHEDNQRLILNFVDTAAGRAALPSYKPLWSFSESRYATARFVPVKWNYAQLSEWYAYLLDTTLGTPGLTAWSLDYPHNAISIGAKDEATRTDLMNELNAAHVPCNLVRTIIVQPVLAAAN